VKKNKKKIFVGVSGGVDSSVSLALLRDAGHDVSGVFIRTWQPDFIECSWRAERRDAMRVCAHLEVPFFELNLEEVYKQGVADYMIAEYAQGRTPNPDVMCNREVKFGGFLEWARTHGADAIATGHYAQTDGAGNLFRGHDSLKDQSYFLWTLTKEQLMQSMFPIGHLNKTDVRRLAELYRLPTAEKKDSQGICFIGAIDMKEFLTHFITTTPGNVLDTTGKVIGHHQGALLYTLGERHGFVITDKTSHETPYYVIAKDMQANTLTVSQHPKESPVSPRIILHETCWRTVPRADVRYHAQIRYHGALMPCTLVHHQDTTTVIFETADYTIAQGQSIVIYEGDLCIGGGIVFSKS
jgi:tRNA-uridine 2-sulfurtransferase